MTISKPKEDLGRSEIYNITNREKLYVESLEIDVLET